MGIRATGSRNTGSFFFYERIRQGSCVWRGNCLFAGFCFFLNCLCKTSVTKSSALLETDIRFRTGMYFNERKTELQIRELYAGYKSQKFDAFLGNQIVTWGRTEGFSPTNNITPDDFSFCHRIPTIKNCLISCLK